MSGEGNNATNITPPLKILRASEGSGKTFALTLHFLRLLLDRPASYREILALTFTNKATAEMKSRILEALEALASDSSNPKAAAYFQELQSAFPEWTREQIRRRADQAYRNILHDYSRFSVQTIDRFSQQVIRSFTYELGLDSGFRIELNTDKVGRDLMNRLYGQLNENPALFDWILERMLRQIEEDKPWNINQALLDLSRIIFSDDFRKLEEVYSRKGNEDLFDRLAREVLSEIVAFEEVVLQSTNLIAQQIESFGVTADELYYRASNFLLKFKNYKEKPGDLSALRAGVAKLADKPDAYQSAKSRTPRIDELYSKINPEIVSLHQILQDKLPAYQLLKAVDENIHYLRLLRDMAELLSEWRTDNGAQLISDAQTLLARIGRTEGGDPTFIWEKIGNRYRNFLFDEFQDTSHAQWDNLMPLLINALGSQDSSNPAHLIVEDVKQSIYRWRDGDFRILLDGVENGVASAFHLSDAGRLISKESLRYNYRSARQLIEFNNFLYTRMPDILQESINEQAKEAMGDQYDVLWVQQGLHDTIIRAYEDVVQEIPPNKNAEKESGAIHVEYFSVEARDENERVGVAAFREEACAKTFDQIREWISQKAYKAGEIGILVRTKNEASLLIDYFKAQQALGELGFQVISGDALLLSSHAAIKAIIAALRFLAFEGREYNSYLSEMLYQYGVAKGQPMDADAWLVAGGGRLQDLGGWLPESLIVSWEELKQLPLASQVDRLIREFDFNEDGSALPYLLTLMDTVANFMNIHGSGLLGFLEFWKEEGAVIPLSADNRQDAVEILTIHKSKGLEYEAVMVPFCNWNLAGKADGQVWFDVSDVPIVAEFESIPLKFGKKVRESVIFDQYYKERLYNYMDALNALYVATTRARSFLWVLSPKPAKKKQEDIKVNNVGSLLYKALEKHEAMTEEGSLSLGAVTANQAPELQQTELGDQTETTLSLHGYSGSNLLSTLLSKKMDIDLEQREKFRASASFSTCLHELMANLPSTASIGSAVAHLIGEGRLDQREGEQATILLHNAWSHPVLGPLLSSGYRQGNERAIIDTEGRAWRPDKVLFAEKETIVIDFKLSSALSDPSHINQLKGYMEFLQQLALPGVRGYLYYFLQNEMIEVHEK